MRIPAADRQRASCYVLWRRCSMYTRATAALLMLGVTGGTAAAQPNSATEQSALERNRSPCSASPRSVAPRLQPGAVERGAHSVCDYLVQLGIERGAVGTAGFGESHSLVSNDTPAGRQRNRRVEIVILGDALGTTAARTQCQRQARNRR